MQICVDSPIPSMDAILQAFLSKIPFPPHLPNLPKFPLVLPNPLFAGFRLPNMEMITMALELQAAQLQNTLVNMVKPMLDLLGMSLDSFLPKIPGLGLHLLDLLSSAPDAIVNAVKNAIAAGFRWPGIPSPLFPKFSLPSMEALQTLQMIVADYMAKVAGLIPALIKKVTDKLKIPGISFPTLPTKDEIIAMVLSLIPGVPDIGALIDRCRDKIEDVIAMLSSLSFPGFPPLPSIPWPLIPNFRLPDFEFNYSLTALVTSLTTGLMTKIMDFIENTLKRFLGFSFPQICVSI